MPFIFASQLWLKLIAYGSSDGIPETMSEKGDATSILVFWYTYCGALNQMVGSLTPLKVLSNEIIQTGSWSRSSDPWTWDAFSFIWIFNFNHVYSFQSTSTDFSVKFIQIFYFLIYCDLNVFLILLSCSLVHINTVNFL